MSCVAGCLWFLFVARLATASGLVSIEVIPPYSNSTSSHCTSSNPNVWKCPSVASAVAFANNVNFSSSVRLSFTGFHTVSVAPLKEHEKYLFNFLLEGKS